MHSPAHGKALYAAEWAAFIEFYLLKPAFRHLNIVFNIITLHIKLTNMENSLLTRITLDPGICHGKPIIRNTRYSVEGIIEYMAGGDSVEDILAEFPDLAREDILACLAFAAESVNPFKCLLHTRAGYLD